MADSLFDSIQPVCGTQPQQAIQSLEQDIRQLHESMTLLHDLVRDQQPALDSIEDSIHYSNEQAQSAQQNLQRAEEYHASTSSLNHLLALAGMVLAGTAYLLL